MTLVMCCLHFSSLNIYNNLLKLQLMLSDVENHHRLVNELAERVANLEALSENPEVADSLADVQNRYDRVRNRARVSVANRTKTFSKFQCNFHQNYVMINKLGNIKPRQPIVTSYDLKITLNLVVVSLFA